MKNALWFSRHELTADQREEISSRGYQLVSESEGKTFGALPVNDEGDLAAVMAALRGLGVDAVFGVFPAPIQAELSILGQTADPAEVPVFAAWNVNRAPEGERPQFAHRKFVRVGTLEVRR